MPLKVFYASVSGNLELKKKQEKLFLILDSKKIDYEKVDITVCTENKDLMRTVAGNPSALAPQISNGDDYCGDFAAFENAIEMEELEQFLKL